MYELFRNRRKIFHVKQWKYSEQAKIAKKKSRERVRYTGIDRVQLTAVQSSNTEEDEANTITMKQAVINSMAYAISVMASEEVMIYMVDDGLMWATAP